MRLVFVLSAHLKYEPWFHNFIFLNTFLLNGFNIILWTFYIEQFEMATIKIHCITGPLTLQRFLNDTE